MVDGEWQVIYGSCPSEQWFHPERDECVNPEMFPDICPVSLTMIIILTLTWLTFSFRAAQFPPNPPSPLQLRLQGRSIATMELVDTRTMIAVKTTGCVRPQVGVNISLKKQSKSVFISFKGPPGEFVITDMTCPAGLTFNEVTQRCDFPSDVPECAALLAKQVRDLLTFFEG